MPPLPPNHPPFQALLIGRSHAIQWPLPALLAKAGFSVDVITSSRWMKHSRFVRNCLEIPHENLLPALRKALETRYDWVIVTEDITLLDIVRSPLSIEEKLTLLPVLQEGDFSHLYSKIGLSKVLSKRGVQTPPFRVAWGALEIEEAARELGYPVFVKIDASGGGGGTSLCCGEQDVRRLREEFFERPLLVQKKVFGKEIDLSAIYRGGKLLHFSYSEIQQVCLNPFGPSSIRLYRPLSEVKRAIFQELEAVGEAVGADGFTNLSAIETREGERFYFEIDMRPNVWVNYPQFLGEEVHPRIGAWFERGISLSFPVEPPPHGTKELLIPFFLRLKRWEILFNRHQVWRFIPHEDPRLVFWLLFERFFFLNWTGRLIAWVKRWVPKRYHPFLKRVKRALSAQPIFHAAE